MSDKIDREATIAESGVSAARVLTDNMREYYFTRGGYRV